MPFFRKTPRTAAIDLGDFTVEVAYGAVKNLNLRVLPPDASVRVSAPWYVSLSTIRGFVLSKRDWIAKQRQRIRGLESIPKPDGPETLFLWGVPYRLRVEESPKTMSVTLESDEAVLRIRPDTLAARRQKLIDLWYRDQVQAELPALFASWEPRLGVRSQKILLQKMKSRWGTCQPSTGIIRLNTELAKKPRECLEYVVVHELAHLIEASHGPRFVAVMDEHLPRWREIRKILNERQQGPSERED